MAKKKTKSNVVAHVVKQGGDRQGHNLFLQSEIGGIPIMLRLEPIVKRAPGTHTSSTVAFSSRIVIGGRLETHSA